ncbi:MAG: AAA family ATPase [Rhodomicrobium sp.]
MSADIRTQVSFGQSSNSQASPTAVFVEPLVTPAPPRELSQRDDEYRREATWRGALYLAGGIGGIKRMMPREEIPQAILLGIRLATPFAGLLPKSMKDEMRRYLGTTDLSMLFVSQDFAQARHWLGIGKDLGASLASMLLGAAHFYGLGGAPDYSRALQYLKLGISSFEGEKQRTPNKVDDVMKFEPDYVATIGYMYQHGLGVDADVVLARRWYEKALSIAEKDDLGGFAPHALGDLYRIGLGVTPNPRKANDFYAKAVGDYQKSGSGDLNGIHLGRLCRFGLGIPADADAAKRWFLAYRATNNPLRYVSPANPAYDEVESELFALQKPDASEVTSRISFLLHPLKTLYVSPIPPSGPEEETQVSSSSSPSPSGPAAGVDPQPQAAGGGKLEQSLARLDGLIGLPEVKSEIRQFVDIALFNRQRAERGLKPLQLAMHLVFTGNPGTGKTTVARLLGDIYASLNLLKSGHLVETDKSGLTGQYLGESTARTKAMIEKALDGVLFIDEAYALTRPGLGNQYGQEAVDILLKGMEDYRDRLVVIAAGYPTEMKEFIASNPGLASRFTNVIQFRDYSADEMLEIFETFVLSNEMRLSEVAGYKVRAVCSSLKQTITVDFANGRLVRNLFEQSAKNMARRIASGDRDLETMIDRDIPDFSSSLKANTNGDQA